MRGLCPAIALVQTQYCIIPFCPSFVDPSLTVRADITGRYSNRLYAYEPSDVALRKCYLDISAYPYVPEHLHGDGAGGEATWEDYDGRRDCCSGSLENQFDYVVTTLISFLQKMLTAVE